jgi:hypothetical protein
MACFKDGVFRRRRGATKVRDLILYFADGQVRHAGIAITTSGRVRSKWGQAEVHVHEIWEVPMAYGSPSQIYVSPAPMRILRLIGA